MSSFNTPSVSFAANSLPVGPTLQGGCVQVENSQNLIQISALMLVSVQGDLSTCLRIVLELSRNCVYTSHIDLQSSITFSNRFQGGCRHFVALLVSMQLLGMVECRLVLLDTHAVQQKV